MLDTDVDLSDYFSPSSDETVIDTVDVMGVISSCPDSRVPSSVDCSSRDPTNLLSYRRLPARGGSRRQYERREGEKSLSGRHEKTERGGRSRPKHDDETAVIIDERGRQHATTLTRIDAKWNTTYVIFSASQPSHRPSPLVSPSRCLS